MVYHDKIKPVKYYKIEDVERILEYISGILLVTGKSKFCRGELL
jgi:hypothetical protein